ncbi:Mitochondrial inner membrane protease subunit 1 [Linum perenne]
MWSFIREVCDKTLMVAKAYGILHVTNSYICTLALAYGPSMIPTINLTGDLVLAERVSPRIGKVSVGDVVIVRSPVIPRRVLTKRVLGMEGDRVTYLLDPHNRDEVHTIVVPRGHVWVQGDNIYNSKDSRDFGPVPYALVEAKLFWRVFISSSLYMYQEQIFT